MPPKKQAGKQPASQAYKTGTLHKDVVPQSQKNPWREGKFLKSNSNFIFLGKAPKIPEV